MSNKERYKSLCDAEPSIPLFLQYWWMESVCHGKQWDVALASHDGGVTAAMPYLFGRRLGMTYIMQPQLTQFSGPWFFYPDSCTESQRLDFEKDAVGQLLAQIDSIHPAYIAVNCSPAVTNWLPFYWKGFSQTTRYTYRLDDISDPERLFADFDIEKRQRKILRYKDKTTVRYDMSPADFALFHEHYWNSKGKKDLLTTDFIERVCSAAIAHNSGVIASLHDDGGRLLMARFVAYDKSCAYSLLSAYDVALHRNGHSETLLWHLLNYLCDKTKVFDFEGSMDEGIEYFYRSFGSRQTPYFALTKCNRLLFRLLLKMHK